MRFLRTVARSSSEIRKLFTGKPSAFTHPQHPVPLRVGIRFDDSGKTQFAHGAEHYDHVPVEHGSDDLEDVFEAGVCGASLGQDP